MTSGAGAVLLDERLMRNLDRLKLVPRRRRAGFLQGERRSTRKGTSIEFADYRDYTPGDDLRRVDWHAYARSDHLYSKLYEDEQELTVHVLVDTSASMDWGEPRKLDYAARLAAALGYVALASLDRLLAATIGATTTGRHGPARGRRALMGYLDFLRKVVPARETNLNRALTEYVDHTNGAGLLFLLTDAWSPGLFDGGLHALQARGFETTICHLLSPEELDPQIDGEFRLIDVETRGPIEVDANASLLARYHEAMTAWRGRVRGLCERRGAQYVEVLTTTPLEEVLLRDLRRLQILR